MRKTNLKVYSEVGLSTAYFFEEGLLEAYKEKKSGLFTDKISEEE